MDHQDFCFACGTTWARQPLRGLVRDSLDKFLAAVAAHVMVDPVRLASVRHKVPAWVPQSVRAGLHSSDGRASPGSTFPSSQQPRQQRHSATSFTSHPANVVMEST